MSLKVNIDGDLYENNERILHSLTLGTVTVGTSPSATITNVSGAATLDLVIPGGPTGPVGPTGYVDENVSVTGTGDVVQNLSVSGSTLIADKGSTNALHGTSVTGAGNVVSSVTTNPSTGIVEFTKGITAFNGVTVTGAGNAVTSITGSGSNILVNKGTTFLTEVTPTGIRNGLGFIPYHIEIGNTQPSGPTVWFQATKYSSNADGTTNPTNYTTNKVV